MAQSPKKIFTRPHSISFLGASCRNEKHLSCVLYCNTSSADARNFYFKRMRHSRRTKRCESMEASRLFSMEPPVIFRWMMRARETERCIRSPPLRRVSTDSLLSHRTTQNVWSMRARLHVHALFVHFMLVSTKNRRTATRPCLCNRSIGAKRNLELVHCGWRWGKHRCAKVAFHSFYIYIYNKPGTWRLMLRARWMFLTLLNIFLHFTTGALRYGISL